MEDSKAKLFVNSPNALDGNNESKLDSASAKFQAEAGVVDFTGDEETIANGVRQLFLCFLLTTKRMLSFCNNR
mgnify:CR=1 FL=1